MDGSNPSRVALVTGSGRRRVGHVVARDLGSWGYSVAIHYNRSAASAREVLEEFESAGVDAATFQADVSKEPQVDRLVQDVLRRFGRLDLLVTTASVWDAKPLEEVTAEDLLRNFQVNALGTFLCARRAGLAMVAQPEGGAIVTLGDWAIERPYRDHAAYFLAKGAIPTMTRMLAVELALRNPRVRVNSIHPGPVMFPPDTSPTEQQEMIESTLVKQANCPQAISQTVRLLAENPFITGVCLPVDGGRTIFAPDDASRDRPI